MPDSDGPASLLETWVKRAGVILGIITILAPALGYRRSQKRPKGRTSGRIGRYLTWPGMMGIACLYLAGGYLLWRPVPLRLSKLARLICVLFGAILYYPGVGLYLWGYRALGKQFSPSTSSGAQLYADHQLVLEGPYKLVRHPMYLGVLLAAVGALLIYRTWAMIVYALSSLVVIVRAHREEELLANEFGSEWEKYRHEVPMWLPQIWRKSLAD
jgi:protein-S-isoprenylcysteine O-methyltransferase Ste14